MLDELKDYTENFMCIGYLKLTLELIPKENLFEDLTKIYLRDIILTDSTNLILKNLLNLSHWRFKGQKKYIYVKMECRFLYKSVKFFYNFLSNTKHQISEISNEIIALC